jgi:hypothetical protein
MGIVKISEQMHENLRVAGSAMSRSINAQAEHWMRVGMLLEMHPELNHREICQRLIQAELAGGLDIAAALGGTRHSEPPQGRAPTAGQH